MGIRTRFRAGAAILAAAALPVTLLAHESAGAQTPVHPLGWFNTDGSGGWEIWVNGSDVSDGGQYGAPTDKAFLPTAWVTSESWGTFRDSDGTFRIDWDDDPFTDLTVRYGAAGDIPVAGFLAPPANGAESGVEAEVGAIGVFRPSDGKFRLDANRDGRTDSTIRYGAAGDVPMLYDANWDLRGDLAVWRPTDGKFRIDLGRNGTTDRTIAFGTAGDLPFVGGDVNDDGFTDIGVYRPSDRKVRVDTDGDGITNFSYSYDAEAPNPPGALPYVQELSLLAN